MQRYFDTNVYVGNWITVIFMVFPLNRYPEKLPKNFPKAWKSVEQAFKRGSGLAGERGLVYLIVPKKSVP